jgi:hypothetical protein
MTFSNTVLHLMEERIDHILAIVILVIIGMATSLISLMENTEVKAPAKKLQTHQIQLVLKLPTSVEPTARHVGPRHYQTTDTTLIVTNVCLLTPRRITKDVRIPTASQDV